MSEAPCPREETALGCGQEGAAARCRVSPDCGAAFAAGGGRRWCSSCVVIAQRTPESGRGQGYVEKNAVECLRVVARQEASAWETVVYVVGADLKTRSGGGTGNGERRRRKKRLFVPRIYEMR